MKKKEKLKIAPQSLQEINNIVSSELMTFNPNLPFDPIGGGTAYFTTTFTYVACASKDYYGNCVPGNVMDSAKEDAGAGGPGWGSDTRAKHNSGICNL